MTLTRRQPSGARVRLTWMGNTTFMRSRIGENDQPATTFSMQLVTGHSSS